MNAFKAFHDLIAFVGRHMHPRLYRHIQPHDHATARLARSFSLYLVDHKSLSQTLPDRIEAAGFFHDIGKYSITESIVLKPGKLTRPEMQSMEQHSVIGNRLLSSMSITDCENILSGVLHHHEHWDGTGYPDALSGTRIPLIARILAVCDTFISLREEREYKDSWPVEKTFDEMDNRMAGRVLDPAVLEDFHSYHSFHKQHRRKLCFA